MAGAEIVISLAALFAVVLGVLGTVFWIWMLVDCATKEADTGNTKIVWVIIIAITNVIGAALYFFLRRPQRRVEVGR
ncbi:MAG: PLD nuclease N-terminal domain-containing protein [Dehalococcoidia bacterium]